jgi:hypothetical protein
MDFQTLFGLFYTKYRGEETPPDTTDPEWQIAIRNYNDALQRMYYFDDTKWNFLFSTLQAADDGDRTLSESTASYAAPSDMAEPGGLITYIDLNGGRANRPVSQLSDIQIRGTSSSFAYFLGDQHNGYTLYVNPAPTAAEDGYGLDYTYYKLLDPATETGSSLVVGGDPSFYYNHMLAQRFLDSRNFPAYSIAKRDAEEALKAMKLKNNSGTFHNPWGVSDTGPGFGV